MKLSEKPRQTSVDVRHDQMFMRGHENGGVDKDAMALGNDSEEIGEYVVHALVRAQQVRPALRSAGDEDCHPWYDASRSHKLSHSR